MLDFPFDEEIARKSVLLMNAELHRFSYAVVDLEYSKLKALVEVKNVDINLDTLGRIVAGDELFRMPFLHTRVSWNTPHFTFVPFELYDESKLSAYARLVSPTEGDTLLVSSLNAAQSKNIFAIPSEVYTWFTQQFKQISIHSQADSFIQSVLVQYSLSASNALFVNCLAGSRVEAVLLQNGRFMFYNMFQYEGEEEMLYYLMAVCKQFDINPGDFTVNLSGDIEPQSAESQLLLQYFGQVQLVASVSFLDVPVSFSMVAMHRFFSTLGLNLCAS